MAATAQVSLPEWSTFVVGTSLEYLPVKPVMEINFFNLTAVAKEPSSSLSCSPLLPMT